MIHKDCSYLADKLHAVHHENESIDERHNLVEVWMGVTWLENFFEEHKNGLEYFDCSVEEVVMITLEDEDDIFQYIEELIGTGNFAWGVCHYN